MVVIRAFPTEANFQQKKSNKMMPTNMSSSQWSMAALVFLLLVATPQHCEAIRGALFRTGRSVYPMAASSQFVSLSEEEDPLLSHPALMINFRQLLDMYRRQEQQQHRQGGRQEEIADGSPSLPVVRPIPLEKAAVKRVPLNYGAQWKSPRMSAYLAMVRKNPASVN